MPTVETAAGASFSADDNLRLVGSVRLQGSRRSVGIAMHEDLAEKLRPIVSLSHFHNHPTDWDKFYEFIDYVSRIEPRLRPEEQEVRDVISEVYRAMRPAWADALCVAYRRGLAMLDHLREGPPATVFWEPWT